MLRSALAITAFTVTSAIFTPAVSEAAVSAPVAPVTAGFGSASSYGAAANGPTEWDPVVGMASTPSGNGYWQTTRSGGVFSFGDATFYGSMGGTQLAKPVVGIAAMPDGMGYWLVASDGGIFSFGNAKFYGSTGNIELNKPVVGMASTPTGKGYWFVASDGGIFAYGDASFWGSAGATPINKPVVGMASTPDGKGYWLVASDGGIFTYGSATFYGSAGAVPLAKPVIGMQATADGKGYWLAASDGGIFTYGNAPFLGSLKTPADQQVRAFAARPQGDGYWHAAYPAAIYGQAGYYPDLPAGSGANTGKRVVYCVSCGRVWLVDNQEFVVRSYLVSGKQGTPAPGVNHVFERYRYTESDLDHLVKMEYYVGYIWSKTTSLGFHTIPTKNGVPIQSMEELGSFKSHGCARQAVEDAIALWDFTPYGTTVVVVA